MVQLGALSRAGGSRQRGGMVLGTALSEALVPLSRVAELLLKRPVHYVVVVVKATATDPWYATADEEEQRTVGALLDELAPAEPETQRQESGTADDDESGALGRSSRQALTGAVKDSPWRARLVCHSWEVRAVG